MNLQALTSALKRKVAAVAGQVAELIKTRVQYPESGSNQHRQ